MFLGCSSVFCTEHTLDMNSSWLGMYFKGELKMLSAQVFHFGLLQLFLEYPYLLRYQSCWHEIIELSSSLHYLRGNEL